MWTFQNVQCEPSKYAFTYTIIKDNISIVKENKI
jgi:hypothetical protein